MANDFIGISTADLEARLAELKSRQPAQALSMDNLASVYAQAQKAGDPFADLFNPDGLDGLSEQDIQLAQQRYTEKYGPNAGKIPDTIFKPATGDIDASFASNSPYTPTSPAGQSAAIPQHIPHQQQQPVGTNSVLANAYTDAMLKQGTAGITQPVPNQVDRANKYNARDIAAPPTAVPAFYQQQEQATQPGFLQRIYNQQRSIQQPVRGDANFLRER